MKIIGITGGIGSGKSMVCEILQKEYNAYLINMDQIAHSLMEPGKVSYELIVNHFGKEILDGDNKINRNKLGEIVYKDEEELLKLNSFTHPYVKAYSEELIENLRKSNREIVCVESALPVEAKLRDLCDEVWYVKASEQIRRKRLMESRNYSSEKIDSIFEKQKKEEYSNQCTHIIINDSTQDDLKRQIDELLRK